MCSYHFWYNWILFRYAEIRRQQIQDQLVKKGGRNLPSEESPANEWSRSTYKTICFICYDIFYRAQTKKAVQTRNENK